MAATYTCPPELMISKVGDLHDRLVEALQAEGDVIVDASAVERIDGAGLQLLYAFAKDLAKSQRSLHLNPSPVVRDALAAAGLTDVMSQTLAEEPPS